MVDASPTLSYVGLSWPLIRALPDCDHWQKQPVESQPKSAPDPLQLPVPLLPRTIYVNPQCRRCSANLDADGLNYVSKGVDVPETSAVSAVALHPLGSASSHAIGLMWRHCGAPHDKLLFGLLMLLIS